MHDSIKNYLNRAENFRKLSDKYESLELIQYDGELKLLVKLDYSKVTNFLICDDEDPDKDYDVGNISLIFMIVENDEDIFIEVDFYDRVSYTVCRGNFSCGIPKMIRNGYQRCFDESDEDYNKRSLEENFNSEKFAEKLKVLGINDNLIERIISELELLVITD